MQEEYGVFTGGVRPGSVTTEYEVKILICCILREAGVPVSYEQLCRALQGQELVNYFELARAIPSLEKAGQIESGPGGLRLTVKGEETAAAFADSLPRAVRERAGAAMERILKLLRREKENRVEIEEKEDGYMLTLTITDIGSDLLRLSLFLPSREECEVVRRRFLNDPSLLYKGVLALATGDLETVGEILPSEENLFED